MTSTFTAGIAHIRDMAAHRVNIGANNCKLRVREGFLVPSNGTATAAKSWAAAPDQHLDHNPSRAPAYSFGWMTGGGKGSGHVVVNLGGGRILTPGGPADPSHWYETTAADLLRRWPNLKWVGWTRSIDGKFPEQPVVVTPPKPIGRPRPGSVVADVVVATNNVMSLPKNPSIGKTLLASTTTPTVVGLQELDPKSFKKVAESLPGFNLIDMPSDVTYAEGILYDEAVWEYEAHYYVKQYDGAHGVSYTRHFVVAKLRHKRLGFSCIFIPYHAVTAGGDKQRVAMRRQGLAALRKEIRKYRAAGIPLVVMGDYNATATQHPTATLKLKHGIDHIYFWNGKRVTGSKKAVRTVATRSDHDVFIAHLSLTVKE